MIKFRQPEKMRSTDANVHYPLLHHSDGDIPYCSRKHLAKYDTLENPTV